MGEPGGVLVDEEAAVGMVGSRAGNGELAVRGEEERGRGRRGHPGGVALVAAQIDVAMSGRPRPADVDRRPSRRVGTDDAQLRRRFGHRLELPVVQGQRAYRTQEHAAGRASPNGATSSARSKTRRNAASAPWKSS